MRRAATFMASLIAAMALSGCTAPEDAAPVLPTGRIDGAVLGPLLSPYGNHTVRLVELDRTDTTSDLGGFTFRNVPPGKYNLTAGDDTTHPLRREITVYSDITRVILQLRPLHIPFPHVAYLQRHGGTDLAMPGEACDACGWSTALHETADAVVVEASWDSPSAGDLTLGGTLLVEVLDQAGQLVAELEGHSPLWAYLPGRTLPSDLTDLHLRVSFGSDFVPQRDFEMDSFLTIYHDLTPEDLSSS